MQSRRYTGGSSLGGTAMPVRFSSSLPSHVHTPSIPSSSQPYVAHPALPARPLRTTMKRASSSSSGGQRGSRSQPFEGTEERPPQPHYGPPQPYHPHVQHSSNAFHSPHHASHPAPHSMPQLHFSSPSQTHTSTAHSHHQQQPPPPAQQPPPASATQPANTAYVTNLQQQIYFLELELQLLKQTNPTLTGASTDPDAPIDSLVTSLREKYVQQTTQHDIQRTELQSKLDAVTQQLQLSDKESERTALELEALKERAKEWKETAREKRADAMLWEKRAHDGEGEAADKQAVLAQRVEKLEAQVRQQCVDRAMDEDRWKEESKDAHSLVAALKDEVHKLRDRNHSLQQKEVELQHQLEVQPHHALREEMERLKAQQRDREKHWREMQLKLEERDEQVAVLERQRDSLSEDNYELRKKAEAEAEERRVREDEEAARAGGRQKWSEELVMGRHAHATISDEVAACKDRIERLRQQLKEEKEEKLGLLHTVKEWEQRIAHQHQEDDKRAQHSQQQKQQLDQLTIDFQLLRDDHIATQQRLATTESDKTATQRRLDESDVELQQLRRQAELLRLMEGVNVNEMAAAATSHQRMADVIGRLVGQMASRGADEDKRDAGRYRVDEMNAGGLESARSEVVVKRLRDRDEEKMREEDVESDGGSLVDSPRSVSSSSSSSSSYSSRSSSSALSSARSSAASSRPSSAASLSRPMSAASSVSLSSAMSGISSSRASAVRESQVKREARGVGQIRSGTREVIDRQRLVVRPNHGGAERAKRSGEVKLYS